ncbi:MAG: formate dehydrogenase accessory sulfurtransferase FdhD [Proteobacteria bacterium]|nr:formate dehydrogenase accessory sulfurtransferase FdhD [Pseudomonadota bacterium]
MEGDIINTGKVSIIRFSDAERIQVDDIVIVEEPLEIFIDDEPFYTTMRMPGEEILLALGICFTDGIIDSMEDVTGVNYCSDVSRNKINVYLNSQLNKKDRLKNKQRRSTAYSSCGICGMDMIEGMTNTTGRIEQKVTMDIATISNMQKAIQENQVVFPLTGGTHAAGIFSAEGELLSFSEDVGRHNALDKAIGKLLFNRSTAKAAVVVLTSRLSFEMVQKAARLGAEIICGVSSPTSLAIDLAKTVNLTLIGFLRGNRGNIYTCPGRIKNGFACH